jgi:hypothetical protein
MADLEFVGLDIDDPESELIYTKTEFDNYIIVAKILNYPTPLIQKLENLSMSAPESVIEAENIEQQIVDSRNKALTVLKSFTLKK